jgi:hypothetical protein
VGGATREAIVPSVAMRCTLTRSDRCTLPEHAFLEYPP